jgi:hypothetical protein
LSSCTIRRSAATLPDIPHSLSDCHGWCLMLHVCFCCVMDPQRFNTLGWALGDDMIRAVNHLRQVGGVQALTLQGAGSTFCAGGNPYASSSGLVSIVASSRALLVSVQVCLRGDHRKLSWSPSYLLAVCCSGLHRCARSARADHMRCTRYRDWRRGRDLLPYRLAHCGECGHLSGALLSCLKLRLDSRAHCRAV